MLFVNDIMVSVHNSLNLNFLLGDFENNAATLRAP